MFVCINSFLYATHSEETTFPYQDTLQEIQVGAERVRMLEENPAITSTTVFIKQIEQEQRMAAKDISAVVPNFYIPDYGSKMTSSIYIRGVGARIDNPVMGMYIDNIGIANKNSYDFGFYDIRRVEVFRGPQGTLFGKNTIGGLIGIATLSPLEYSGVRASVSYGNYNTADARAAYYHKFSDKLGVSAAFRYGRTDGYYKNVYDNSKADGSQEAGGRVKFEGITKNETKWSGVVQYDYTTQQGFAYHLPDKPVNHNDPCAYLRHNLLTGLTVKWNLPKYMSLSSTTSYQFLQDDMLMDQDYLPLSYFTLQQKQTEHYISEELLLKPQEKKELGWDWISGVSVSYKHNRMSAPVTFKQDGIDTLILKNANMGIGKAGLGDNARIEIQEPQFVIGSEFWTNTANVALFHTSYYRWNKWQLEAGIRLDMEYSAFKYDSNDLLHYRFTLTMPQFKALETSVKGNTSLWYIEPLPRVAATYKRKNWQTYISVSEGYKAGGFNTQLFADILRQQIMLDMMSDLGVYMNNTSVYDPAQVITYKPERCLTFETGLQGYKNIGQTVLQGNLTLYELEVFNQQLTVFPDQGTGRLMTNAGHSRSAGVEVEAKLNWKNLTIQASYGYTYAYFVNYDNGYESFDGNKVPYAPSNTLYAGVLYNIPFTHKVFQALTIGLNTNGYGKIYWDEQNQEVQNFYALLNANISLKMKYFTLDLWGKNLTNYKYDVFRFVSMGNSFMQSGKPLTFGATLKFEV